MPEGRDREIPRYRVTRELQPAQKARFRHEPPFSESWQSDVWQYGDRVLAAGEELEITAWPHPSMAALNVSAKAVLEFFKLQMKSRLPLSPWHNGRLRLDTGISNAPGIAPKPLYLQPMNLRPVA